MSVNVRHVLGRMLACWIAFWRSLEGSELEPRIWHSHYLSHRVSRDVLKRLGNRLKGRVIDIGAGTGHGEVYLGKDVTTYYPTDLPSGRDVNDRHISRKGKAPVRLHFRCMERLLILGGGHQRVWRPNFERWASMWKSVFLVALFSAVLS